MQQRLAIDYWDGTIKPKTLGQKVLYHLVKACEKNSFVAIHPENGSIGIHTEVDMPSYVRDMDVTELDKQKQYFLAESLLNISEDVIKLNHAAYTNIYKQSQGKNFIFSKPLTEMLIRTKANVTLDVLPEEEFCYYFEMPGLKDADGTEAKGILIVKINLPEERRVLGVLYYTPLNAKNIDGYLEYWSKRDSFPDKTLEDIKAMSLWSESIEIQANTIPFKEGDTETFENALVQAAKANNGPSTGCDLYTIEDMRLGCFNTIINGLLYVLSGEENLTLERNEFAKKKSKAEGQKKVYTTKPFYTVGKDVKFLRDYNQDAYYWRPFFRKAPKGDSSRKTVFVKGHFKHFKKKLDE